VSDQAPLFDIAMSKRSGSLIACALPGLFQTFSRSPSGRPLSQERESIVLAPSFEAPSSLSFLGLQEVFLCWMENPDVEL